MRIPGGGDARKGTSFIRPGPGEEGHGAGTAAGGRATVDLVLAGPAYDLVVLDLMLPKRDGFGVLKTLRDRGIGTPVLVLTARDSVADKVAGFDLGADDYVTKPFAFEEFLARVRALLRRGTGQGTAPLRLDDLTLDPGPRTATRGARRLHLTLREYAHLEHLPHNAGRVLVQPIIAVHRLGPHCE